MTLTGVPFSRASTTRLVVPYALTSEAARGGRESNCKTNSAARLLTDCARLCNNGTSKKRGGSDAIDAAGRSMERRTNL